MSATSCSGMAYDHRIGFDYLRPGPGVGRVVPSQGHPGPHLHRRAARLRLLAAARRHRDQRGPAGVGHDQDPRRRGGHARRAARWRPGASPSRPAPTTGATRRRWRSCAGSWPRAPRCGPSTPPCTGPVPEFPTGVEICPDAYAACEGAAVRRRAHRVGGAALARLRQGPRPPGRAQRRRRPQPARPGRPAPDGLHLRGHGPAVTRRPTGGGSSSPGARASSARICARPCVARGDRVVGVDDLSTGVADNVAALSGDAALRARRRPT